MRFRYIRFITITTLPASIPPSALSAEFVPVQNTIELPHSSLPKAEYTTMNSNHKAPNLSGLIRIVSFVFLSQLVSLDTRAVDAAYFDFQQTQQLDSCKDYGLEARESLEQFREDCIGFCGENPAEAYDSANLEEDPNYVVRNTVCRCLEFGLSPEDRKIKTFECWTKAQVWDKREPLLKCEEDYDIVSGSTCMEYCDKIDPEAYSFKGFEGSFQCSCGGVEVCNDNPVPSSATGTSAITVTSLLALMAGCLL